MDNNFTASNDSILRISERLYYALLEYMDVVDVLEFLRRPDLTMQDVANKLNECKEARAQADKSPYAKRVVTDRLDPKKGKIYKRSY